jgi:hypothetical protein
MQRNKGEGENRQRVRREFVFEWLSVPENTVRKLEVHERNLV